MSIGLVVKETSMSFDEETSVEIRITELFDEAPKEGMPTYNLHLDEIVPRIQNPSSCMRCYVHSLYLSFTPNNGVPIESTYEYLKSQLDNMK